MTFHGTMIVIHGISLKSGSGGSEEILASSFKDERNSDTSEEIGPTVIQLHIAEYLLLLSRRHKWL